MDQTSARRFPLVVEEPPCRHLRNRRQAAKAARAVFLERHQVQRDAQLARKLGAGDPSMAVGLEVSGGVVRLERLDPRVADPRNGPQGPVPIEPDAVDVPAASQAALLEKPLEVAVAKAFLPCRAPPLRLARPLVLAPPLDEVLLTDKLPVRDEPFARPVRPGNPLDSVAQDALLPLPMREQAERDAEPFRH